MSVTLTNNDNTKEFIKAQDAYIDELAKQRFKKSPFIKVPEFTKIDGKYVHST